MAGAQQREIEPTARTGAWARGIGRGGAEEVWSTGRRIAVLADYRDQGRRDRRSWYEGGRAPEELEGERESAVGYG